MKLKKLAATMVATAALATGGIALSAPTASAALPYCNQEMRSWVGGDLWRAIPEYNGSTGCEMWWTGGTTVNPAVKAMQASLTCRGFSTPADGRFGSGTRDQLKAFQRLRGLEVDGVYGPQTRSAMGYAYWNYKTGTYQCHI